MSAFPRGDLTHAPADATCTEAIARSAYPRAGRHWGSMAWEYPPSFSRERTSELFKVGATRNFLSGEEEEERGGMLSLQGAWSFATGKLLTLSARQFEDCDTVDPACTVGSWILERLVHKRQLHFFWEKGYVLGFDLCVGSVKEVVTVFNDVTVNYEFSAWCKSDALTAKTEHHNSESTESTKCRAPSSTGVVLLATAHNRKIFVLVSGKVQSHVLPFHTWKRRSMMGCRGAATQAHARLLDRPGHPDPRSTPAMCRELYSTSNVEQKIVH